MAKRIVLLVNGPNLNTLGTREPELYGSVTLPQLVEQLREEAGSDIELRDFQSNHEGEILDFLHKHGPEADGVILNGGALTHYSIALRDAIAAIAKPTIEVHITNIHARETFRHHSVTAPLAVGVVAGLGLPGYFFALEWFRQSFATKGS